tara:strand:- start:74738 stop:74995 length:258 start_codon:yes stop_codon:yes gene_type:complete
MQYQDYFLFDYSLTHCKVFFVDANLTSKVSKGVKGVIYRQIIIPLFAIGVDNIWKMIQILIVGFYTILIFFNLITQNLINNPWQL